MTTQTFDFSFEDLIAELERLASTNSDGFTISEMSEATGHSGTWCRNKIRKMIKSGKVKCSGRVKRTTIDGRYCYIPAYVFVDGDNG